MRSFLSTALCVLGCAPPSTGEWQLPSVNKPVLVLLVHGSGDGPERWAANAKLVLEGRLAKPSEVEIVAYDWRAAAADKLSAAGNGESEGAAVGKALLERGLQHVHVVAHSAGAFVAAGLEQQFASATTRPTLHLTFLDPFLGKGLDFGWGATRFGTTADFVESYLNTGDGVPGTELAITAAHTFDVTMSASKPSLSGSAAHWWPIDAWLTLSPGLSTGREVAGTFDSTELRTRFPPGVTEALP